MDDKEILYLRKQIDKLNNITKEQEERILNLEEKLDYLNRTVDKIYLELWEKIHSV